MKDSSQAHLDLLIERFPVLTGCRQRIENACAVLLTSFRAGGKLLVCGNGGSAADAEHIVGELMNRYLLRRPMPPEEAERLTAVAGDDAAMFAEHLQKALPAIALVSQAALATAVANDAPPELLFAQQVYGYGAASDVLMALSTSGNSRNVVCALRVAHHVGMRTIGLTGDTGGAMRELCDVHIGVPATVTYQIQELHLPVYHTICAVVENEFFGS